MQGFAHEHKIPESVLNSGVQIFKLAAMNNFIQGRRMNTVAAVCLYTAARKERPCRVMLIDFADSCGVNVFKLGHTFKALHSKISLSAEGLMPVLPEDLIYRFASKLEFDQDTTKVAETAVRLVHRMSLDWISMGRRPSGICGACLIMAARMHNYRRTVKEVVYVVKVTTATIQKRLDEFKVTASSDLTVEEFLTNQFLESAHDPPSFYKTSAEYLAKKKSRKSRKRKRTGNEDEDDVQSILDGQATRESSVASSVDPGLVINPSGMVRRDADGFAVPAVPPAKRLKTPPPAHPNFLIDPSLLTEEEAGELGDSLEALADTFGPVAPVAPMTAPLPTPPDSQAADKSDSIPSGAPSPEKGKGKAKVADVVNEEWEEDEDELEEEIEEEVSEMIADPHTEEHAKAFKTAEQRAKVHAMIAHMQKPQADIPMTQEVEDTEFADDPEVLNCLLSEEESKLKEQIWVNANKDWLREQQIKLYNQKMADKTPKVRRNRVKKPRIGEGQTQPANSAAEAAVAALKERAISSRLNYNAIEAIFKKKDDVSDTSSLTSAPTTRAPSRVASAAPSVAAPEPEDDVESTAGDYIDDTAAVEDDDGGEDGVEMEHADADDNWQEDYDDDDEIL